MNYSQWYKKVIVKDQSQGKVDYSRKPAERTKVTSTVIRRRAK